MDKNPIDGLYPIPDELLHEFPEEAERRRREERFFIAGGPLGPHLMMLRNPEDLWEEKDPNP